MSITVSDGNAQDVKELYITVTNENEPPEFQHDTYSISGDEGEVSVCYVSIFFEYIFMLQKTYPLLCIFQAGMMIGSPNYGVLDPEIDSTLSFSMNCPPFSIHPSTGYITLRQSFIYCHLYLATVYVFISKDCKKFNITIFNVEETIFRYFQCTIRC